MKLHYNVTVGNFVAVMLITLAIIIKVDSNNPNDLLGSSYLLFTAIIILLIDVFLQWMITDYKKILLIESVALGTLIIISIIP